MEGTEDGRLVVEAADAPRSAHAAPIASNAEQHTATFDVASGVWNSARVPKESTVREAALQAAVPVTSQADATRNGKIGRRNMTSNGADADSESDADDTAEVDPGSEHSGRGGPLPAILPDYRKALPTTWTGAFADPLTEKVYQADAHAVLYPALVLVILIFIVLRVGEAGPLCCCCCKSRSSPARTQSS